VYYTESEIYCVGGLLMLGTSHIIYTMHQEKDVKVFETEQEARTALLKEKVTNLEQKVAKIENSVLRFFL